MPKSRIEKYHHDYNYCELDGKPCIHCRKCDYLPAQSSNWFSRLLIILVIICLIVFVLNPLITMGIEKQHQATVNNSSTLEEQVDNYNSQMSDDERNYRNAVGLGNESVGDNYNSMG